MKVFVTGATGVLGHRIVERLADRGHDVYGLVRDDAGASVVAARGGIPRHGDVLNPDSLDEAIPRVDILIHAATAVPTATKPTEADWAHNDQVRLEGAKNIVAAADDSVERIVFPSVVWVARQSDGSAFDETADRSPDRTSESAAAVEQYLQDAASTHSFEATILRLGFLYAPDAAHTRQFGEGLLTGEMPVIGRGVLGHRDATLSFLHADDAARAFADAIDVGVGGLYHVVDDEPVAFGTFLSALADRLDAPDPNRLPTWLARWFIGRENISLLASSMPTTNERFKADVGWKPRYATYEDGLTQVVQTWKNEGTLNETQVGYEWN